MDAKGKSLLNIAYVIFVISKSHNFSVILVIFLRFSWFLLWYLYSDSVIFSAILVIFFWFSDFFIVI